MNQNQNDRAYEDEVPASSRASGTVELRGNLPLDLITLVDGLAFTRANGSRIGMVEKILREYVDREVHEATVLLRTARINPLLTESGGGRAEKGRAQ